MATFKVTYEIEIDIVGIGCAQEAAWAAWEVMRDPDTTRARFQVLEVDGNGESEQVIVDEDDTEASSDENPFIECDCDDRSWHGDEHDSACPLAGTPRS